MIDLLCCPEDWLALGNLEGCGGTTDIAGAAPLRCSWRSYTACLCTSQFRLSLASGRLCERADWVGLANMRGQCPRTCKSASTAPMKFRMQSLNHLGETCATVVEAIHRCRAGLSRPMKVVLHTDDVLCCTPACFSYLMVARTNSVVMADTHRDVFRCFV